MGDHLVIFYQYAKWITGLVEIGDFLHAWEADQVGAQTEAGALASRHANARRNSIQDGEDNRSEDTKGGDLIQRQSLLRDQDRGGGDNKTLNQVLNNAVDNLSKSVAHLFYILSLEKNLLHRGLLFLTHGILCLLRVTSLKHPNLYTHRG